MTTQLFGRNAHDFRKYLADESKRKGGILGYEGREGRVDTYHFANATLQVRDLRGGVGIELIFAGEEAEIVKGVLVENTGISLN